MQPGGEGGKKGRKLPLVIGGVVVLVLVAAVGLFFVFSGSKEGKQQAWSVPYSQQWVLDRSGQERAVASWVIDDLVVRAGRTRLAGYRIADGSRVWETEAPAGTTLCTASKSYSDKGLAALAYGDPSTCSQVAGIDLRTGELKPGGRINQAPHPKALAPAIAVTGDVVVTSLGIELQGHRLADGRKLWAKSIETHSCPMSDTNAAVAAGGNQVIAYRQCGTGGVNVYALNATTGAKKWSSTQPPVSYIASASPVIVAVSALPAASGDNLVVFDKAGKAVTSFRAATGARDFRTRIDGAQDSRSQTTRSPFWIAGTTFYAERTWDGTDPNLDGEIVAVDLTTGATTWTSSGHKAQFVPMVADEQGMLGLEDETLVRLDPATGKAAKVGAVAFGDDVHPQDNDFYQVNGTLLRLPIQQPVKGPAIAAYR